MSKLYAITRTDGGITIMTLHKDAPLTATLKKEKIRLANRGLTYASHRELKPTHVRPDSRKFRDAWTDALPGDQVDVDIVKAQAVLRTKRNTALTILDKEAVTEARKPGGDVTAIDAKAQKLRDLPTDPRFTSGDLGDLEALFDEV